MGCYVNPQNETKEEFLLKHGKRVRTDLEITDTHLPVCLVDNGYFTAAMVAFNEGEIEAMNSPGDRRPKTWYIVSREELRKVSDLSRYER